MVATRDLGRLKFSLSHFLASLFENSVNLLKNWGRNVPLFVFIFAACVPRLVCATELEHPNIIFILADDLGWGDLGVLHQNDSTHDRKHKTPFLDQMAAEGMQLRAHYCPAPVCAPSRSSLLTGVHQGHASIRNNQFDKMLIDNHTLGTVMQAAGYRTALIGKYGLQGKGNNPETWPGYPTKRGFDEFFGYVAHVDGHMHYPAEDWPLGDSEIHQTKKNVWWNNQEVSADLQKCYTTDLFTARSKHWIVEHQKTQPEQPFFLLLTYDTPHAALQIPTGSYPKEKGLRGGVQWLGKPGQMINTAQGEIDSYRHPDYVGHGWTDAEERFATMVRRIDNAVGDLLQTLRDLGIAENTMVVFTSDNGPHLESYLANVKYSPDSFQSYGPFDGTKRDTWEGGIRMPTLAWWPSRIAAGGINARPSQFHDWLPTMAELGGTAAPARTDGVSLVPSLTGKGEQLDSTIYVEYTVGGSTESYADFLPSRHGKKRGEMQVVHVDGFKGVRTDIQSHSDLFEIYDLKSDPGEEKNLAGTEIRFKQIQQRMHDRVLQLRLPNDSAPRPYDNSLIAGNTDDRAGLLSEDVAWTFHPGDFSYVPSLPAKKAVANLKTKSEGNRSLGLEATAVLAKTPGAVVYEMFVTIDEPGEYHWTFRCPTRGFVRVWDIGLIDADFDYVPGSPQTSTLHLGKGRHPVRVTVLTDDQNQAAFELNCKKVDSEKKN